jgi:hypothetical protein
LVWLVVVCLRVEKRGVPVQLVHEVVDLPL